VSHVTVAIAATKTVTLLLGALIAYLSWRAYGRTGAPALRALSIGFAVVTLGALLGGVADLLIPVDFTVGVLVQSTLTMVGFAVLTYSLYVE
jgi:hypothetical protein